jgi:wyosine [tRNA(Phe)-imidazoG37] synthetase (radical SAM superfamily)
MKFLCCKTLFNDLIFHPDVVAFCCAKVTDELLCFEKYDGSIITKDMYLQARNKFVDNFKKGIIPEVCKKCHNLEEKEWDESIGFNVLSLAHKTKCSICDCFYCTLSQGDKTKKHEANSIKTYDISPIIEYFRNENMILPGCSISVSGGECAEYPQGELEYLTHFAIANDCVIEYLTSAIKYSECIAAALETIPSKIIVSVDSGTKEMYEKIKRVKAYNVVWNNLREYIEKTKNNILGRVFIKYIIIPGVNDTLDEVNAFINKCKEVKCKDILIDMEFSYIAANQHNKAEGNLKKVIQYFYEISKNKEVLNLDFTNDCKFWCIKQVD